MRFLRIPGKKKTQKMLLLHADTTELKKIKNKNMMKVFLEAQNQERKNYFFYQTKWSTFDLLAGYELIVYEKVMIWTGLAINN